MYRHLLGDARCDLHLMYVCQNAPDACTRLRSAQPVQVQQYRKVLRMVDAMKVCLCLSSPSSSSLSPPSLSPLFLLPLSSSLYFVVWFEPPPPPPPPPTLSLSPFNTSACCCSAPRSPPLRERAEGALARVCDSCPCLRQTLLCIGVTTSGIAVNM